MAPRYVFPVVTAPPAKAVATQHKGVTLVACGHASCQSDGRADEANAPSASYL